MTRPDRRSYRSSPSPVVKMYTCGITPYDAAHLGHAATYLAYDVLQRRLRDLGHETQCVRNVTDVDDDILRKARELGVHYLDLAAEEVNRFDADMASLGLLPAFSEPQSHLRHSRHPRVHRDGPRIRPRLPVGGRRVLRRVVVRPVRPGEPLRRGHHVGAGARAGRQPRRSVQARPARLRPMAALRARTNRPGTPCGEPGRPGWHIECSALALRELGETIDLHGGGSDLIFPHHECEAAQSEAATGSRFVRHWMHGGMVRLGGTKMSKSLGNLVFVHDLLKDWEGAAIRLAVLTHHYRSDWDWTEDLMPEAAPDG